MYRGLQTILVMALVAGVCVGCSDEDEVATPEVYGPLSQLYVFETYYVSLATLRIFEGVYIDGSGNKIFYDLGSTSWTPSNPDTLTPAELAEKYSASADTLGRIELADLHQASLLIDGASAGELSVDGPYAADAGSTYYVCYKYDPDHDRYIRVLLAKSGSSRQYNTSPEAFELLDWFSQFGWGRFGWIDDVLE